MKKLDLICLGRAAVDIYAQQKRTRLENAASFKKYLGGSSANMAFGAARMGLRVAMLTRVGNDHMGRFVLSALSEAGVDVSMAQQDEHRLTGLVLLGMESRDDFPLVFYRNNCADMAIEPVFKESDIAKARALAITGTHFSTPAMRKVAFKAIEYAKKNDVNVLLDIDYRPVLWGIGRLDDGESRFAASEAVTQSLLEIFPHCDVLVGTEEEFHIGGGSTHTLTALKAVRAVSKAALVLKRGPLGCQIFTSSLPQQLDNAPIHRAARVEVLNVLGAGDAFMSGLLRGYLTRDNNAPRDFSLKNEKGDLRHPVNWERAARFANACGAIVVSRHACAPAIPTKPELDYYIAHASAIARPDKHVYLNHLHRVTTRTRHWPCLAILAFDHRLQFEEMAREALPPNSTTEDATNAITQAREINANNLAPQNASHLPVAKAIRHAKKLIFRAFESAASRVGQESWGKAGKLGFLCDTLYGEEVLTQAAGKGYWMASPLEQPGISPLSFGGQSMEHYGEDRGAEREGGQPKNAEYKNAGEYKDAGLIMAEWNPCVVAKCLVFFRKRDYQQTGLSETAYFAHTLAMLKQAWHAAQHHETELLLEVIADNGDEEALLQKIEAIYRHGITPDWWKITLHTPQGWQKMEALLAKYDSHCRGVLLLGLAASPTVVNERLQLAAQFSVCKGFAVGRSFFAQPVKRWLGGESGEEECVKSIADEYWRLTKNWFEKKV